MTVGELKRILQGWDNDAKVYIKSGFLIDRVSKLERAEMRASKKDYHKVDVVLIGKDKDGHCNV